MDTLKTAMVAWIIVGHALLGYSSVGGWPYDEINEVSFDPRVDLVLTALLGPTGLFVIGLFFLVAGLLAPGSLERKGFRRYARERATRLGVPFLASALLLWPLSLWLAYRAAGEDRSLWWVLVGRDPPLDSGSLWFAEVLLVLSVGWAVVRRTRPLSPHRRARWEAGRMLALAAALTAATFLVRMWFPARSGQIGDLHLWWWPQCMFMFGLGVSGSALDWTRRVPDAVWRAATLLSCAVIAPLALAAVLLGPGIMADVEPFLGGWHWQALLFAAAESTVVITGSLSLLGLAQRVRPWTGHLAKACGRTAFAAFVVQGPVLLTVATAGRLLAVPAEVKAPLVAVTAVVVSFALGSVATRTRLNRVL